MMLRLHRDWPRILLRSWSVRLMLVAVLLGGVAAGLPIAQPYINVSPIIVACVVGIASSGASLAAIVARLLDQGGFHAPEP